MVVTIAEYYARKYETRDPRELAERLNIEVLDLPFEAIDGICGYFQGRKILGVNRYLEGIEKHLVIAHELGHLILHPKAAFRFHYKNQHLHTKQEYQASVFALALCFGEGIARRGEIKESIIQNGLLGATHFWTLGLGCD